MDFQIVIVLLIMGAACLYVGRMIYRKTISVGKKSVCDIDCGCDSKSKDTFAPSKRN